ncbi:hypothetical protein [Natronorubrum halophilum]|uniref:hypothetical protein n=1 Tax=Natronorubrum halophilum TaxID=1702106 RepID=UPI0013CE78AD|nr:hypothetical protein [Natronorubrum halophilum]
MSENPGYTVFAVIVIAAVGIIPIMLLIGIEITGYIQNILAEIVISGFVLGIIIAAIVTVGR